MFINFKVNQEADRDSKPLEHYKGKKLIFSTKNGQKCPFKKNQPDDHLVRFT